MVDQEYLRKKALQIRQNILAMAYTAGGAHISPAFSIAELLAVLYFDYLNIHADNCDDPGRDRFILSKGHGCGALYAVLAEKGFFAKEELKGFCQSGSMFGGHPDMHLIPGIEASTGSLGHGLSIGVGLALGGKLKKGKFRVIVLLGDGECQEGSIWEASMAAAHLGLENLTAIIDYNKLQGMGPVAEINDLTPLSNKWESFGWAVREIDGHDVSQIQHVLHELPIHTKKPTLIIAHTVKGKGISFMENEAIWHYRLPNKEEMKIACEALAIDDIEKVLS